MKAPCRAIGPVVGELASYLAIPWRATGTFWSPGSSLCNFQQDFGPSKMTLVTLSFQDNGPNKNQDNNPVTLGK